MTAGTGTMETGAWISGALTTPCLWQDAVLAVNMIVHIRPPMESNAALCMLSCEGT